MTDLETLKAMLDRACVPYIEEGVDGGSRLTITVGEASAVTGYSGFLTIWRFNEVGALAGVEIWE